MSGTRGARRGRGRLAGHGSSILVAALSSAFGITLLRATDVLAQAVSRSEVGTHDSAQSALRFVAIVFIVISIYVGSIVITNTFATIVAGRTRSIALLRLLGSSAAAQRRAVATEGLVVGVIGGLVGALIALGITAAGIPILVASGAMPSLDYGLAQPTELLPALAVVLATWLASWLGSRRVLAVTPLQALSAAQELSLDESRRRPVRNTIAIGLFALGITVVAIGTVLGLVSQAAVLISMVGGILSFTGLVLGAHLVMPPVLALTGRLFGRSAPSRLATENATRYPERSARTTIGIVIGVTLITMFVVATQSFQTMIRVAQRSDPELYQGVPQILSVVVTVFSILVGFSAVIAAIGMVNNLSMSIVQRSRELGLLRALGFSSGQVRAMVLVESAQVIVAAVVTGLVLGVFYGWAGAQSLLGSLPEGGGFIVPTLPFALIGSTVLAAAVLTIVASLSPTRKATGVSPVTALAVD